MPPARSWAHPALLLRWSRTSTVRSNSRWPRSTAMACAVDSTLFDPSVPVIVQGITGRDGRTHAQLMRAYGTNVVGGVAASAAASLEPISGIPVFTSCAEAIAQTKARASLIMVPPLNVLAAAEDALAGGVELLVCITEGVPAHDALRLVR